MVNMKHPPPFNGFGPLLNRFDDVLVHTDRFAFYKIRRLAKDAGVSPSSVSRLINNQLNPSFALVARITAAIEMELGMKIDPRDLIAENGEFLTRSVCDLTGCRGCLPSAALDEFGRTLPAFTDVKPGTWVTSRNPKGFVTGKGIR